MAGRHRLIVADITVSNLRGDALKKAIGKMNQPAGAYEALVGKRVPKKQDKKK